MHILVCLITVCYISVTVYLVHCSKAANLHASQTSGSTTNSRVNNDHPICVNVPNNLSFCQPSGWGYKMRLPNLLEHQSAQEVQMHIPTWQQLYNTKCSPDLSLFICSILTPVCLDVIVPPCRSLCLYVKGSCEPIMKRYNYSWPRIIDCNKFPINKDMCISQQPYQQGIELADRGQVTNQTNINSSINHDQQPLPQPEVINSTKKKKPKKNRVNNRKNSTVTNNGQAQSLNTSFTSDQIYDVSKFKDEQRITTTSPIYGKTTTIADATSTTPTTINETYYTDYSYTNQSSVDFIKLFCSTHSEWLIKTKISDLQLYRAQDKRRMKLRSYKQIYGQTGSSKNTKNTTHIVVHLTNKTLALTYNQKSIRSSLFDNLLSNLTVTPYASDSLSGNVSSGSSSSNHNSFYLLAGRTAKNQQRLITMWLVWPKKDSEYNSQSREDMSSDMNPSLLRDYREFKKSVKICNKISTPSNRRKSNSTT